MVGGDVHRASSSLRSGSTSLWRNSDGVFEAFRRSSVEEDDEEALKWASLEKLPSYARLTSSKGDATEIDILQKKNLIERLIGVANEDNESFLLKFKNRLDRVGIDLPSIEVRFEHLNIEAAAHVGVGRALPTLFNFIVGIVEDFFNYLHMLPSRKKPFYVLNNVSGIIKPSRMTLLLGPPSSGKTTLLLALAGKLDPALKVSGRVTYNGHDMHEFVPQRTAAYISQHDLHIGELTVRETLEFSARCQGVGSRYDILAELLRREKAYNIWPDPDIDMFMKAVSTEGQAARGMTDYTLKILGLEVCADTMVGNEMLRGISGGQRKRVTTGEMLVGPAKALFMDEISTGLDCSTTFQIVKSLKQSNHILNGTAIISLLQPAPETYDLFDDIILLSGGHIVYQGSREQVLDFFEYMGFRCPERKDVADFLQQVTSKKDQEQFWARKDDPYRFIMAKEFAEAFHSYHGGQKLGHELAVPYDKTKSHPAALTTNKYSIGKKELLRACASREYLLMKRNSFVYIFRLSQLTILALITMTVFLRTEMHRTSITEGGVYLGALFITLSVIMFDGFAELPMTIAKLPVFYKQRDLLFYPCWAYALPTWILQIPITSLGVTIWVFITYYVIGYDSDVGRLFRQFLLLLLLRQMASGLYRLIAALGRNMLVATTFGFLALVILYVLGGFVLSREDIKKWWIWGYWMSPLMYGQNAIAANEFLGKSWSHVVPNTVEPLGVLVLKSRGLFTHAYWYWLGVGALVGYVFVFNFFYALALTYLNPYDKPRAFMFEESEKKERSSHGCNTVAASEEQRRGMVLPFMPHSIIFYDIVYSVDTPQEMRNLGVVEDKLVLLKGVSGTFRPGVLTALMGVSGAGKTTLMDVLAGRKTGGHIDGNIKISGYPKKQETFARISGYCEQNDIHSPHVTVYESLLYSAWLRLPQQVDTETREMFIEEVMDLVELNLLRHSLVGLPGVSGLSTEQRKRLTIAVELVANPSIIFMDEPTSGLDARAAAIVLRTVRNTVDTGRTVVCTIHQRSIDIFEAFDELFLMKRGGQEIYVGPLGHHSCHLIEYFEGIQGVGSIKDGYNPATWMLEVTCSAQELASGVDFADIYKNSDLFRRNKAVIKQLSTPPPGLEDLKFPTQYSQSFFTQCMACLWKQHCSYWRNPTYTAVRFLFSTAVALLFGTIFWKLGSNISKKQHLFNAMGSMYAALSFIGPLNAIAVLPVVATERTVFYREKAAGMYSALAYAFAQVVIELPYIFVQAVVYGVLVYAMIGFEWTVAKFFWYVFFMFFTLLYFTFYGMMVVAITPNQHIASTVCTLFFSMWSLFSGFLIPRTRIPVWGRWYSWVCPVAWTLYGLFTSQYGHSKQVLLDTDVTVEVFLEDYFGFKNELLGVAAAVVAGIALLFGLIFAVAMNTLHFQSR